MVNKEGNPSHKEPLKCKRAQSTCLVTISGGELGAVVIFVLDGKVRFGEVLLLLMD